jgi:hypothetical protein
VRKTPTQEQLEKQPNGGSRKTEIAEIESALQLAQLETASLAGDAARVRAGLQYQTLDAELHR